MCHHAKDPDISLPPLHEKAVLLQRGDTCVLRQEDTRRKTVLPLFMQLTWLAFSSNGMLFSTQSESVLGALSSGGVLKMVPLANQGAMFGQIAPLASSKPGFKVRGKTSYN